MAHARQTLREAIATVLDAGKVSYSRVYQSRLPPLQQVWPHVAVYDENEADALLTIHPSQPLERDLRIITEGRLQVVGNPEDMEDRMDTLAAEVETKLTYAALGAVFPKLVTLQLLDTEKRIIFDERTDQISHATVVLGWRVVYMTNEGAPETPV